MVAVAGVVTMSKEGMLVEGVVSSSIQPDLAFDGDVIIEAFVPFEDINDAYVVIDGEARAYSLNLLNRHEVVNDRIGEQKFAAVW